MKKTIKKLITILIAIFILAAVSACGVSPEGDAQPTTSPQETVCNVYPAVYADAPKKTDMRAFWEETRDPVANGYTSHDGVLSEGFVESVLHTLKVNGTVVPVYTARCGYNVHSFAWVDVETNGKVELTAELTLLAGNKKTCVVLPEKLGVTAEMKERVVTATLRSYGSYSFTFDKDADMALTLYVAESRAFSVPEGYEVTELAPGTYTREQTTFTESQRVYRLKSGTYDVTSISLPSDTVLLLERGAYLRVYEEAPGDGYAAVTSSGTQNVKIMGQGIFDFSRCVGGNAKTKGVFSFSNVSKIEFRGVTAVNSNNWTLCFNNCRDVTVSAFMALSYRTYSDGVMFSDCKRAVARDCFIRTGDDAMEVKSFYDSVSSDCYTSDVLFENNCVWTDKGIAYGCIYEAKHNVENVRFIGNSVGFAQAAWSEHLGCCTVQMGSNKNAVWKDVRFEDIEVYRTNCSLISVFNRAVNEYEGGYIKDIYFKNVSVKHAESTDLPVYAVSVVLRLEEGAKPTNSRIGNLYLDGINFEGTAITSANLEEYLNWNIAEGAFIAKKILKVGTLASVSYRGRTW